MEKKTVEAMRAYLEVALRGFEEHFDVQVEIGKIRYGRSNAKIALQVSEVAEDGSVETVEVVAFKTQAHLYGLRPEWLGREFEHASCIFNITGLNTRARKFKIQAVSRTGERYKFPATMIKKIMESPSRSL
jgi:hypothetical protein